MANPTLRRQVQVGFSEELTYGGRLDTAPIIRPVVRAFEITPTQSRMNIGRTGSIDPSRTFFSTQMYTYTMTVEVDPSMAMWFLKWGLGNAYATDVVNNYRIAPVPLDGTLTSFSIYLDTNQTDFIDTNERTLLFLGGMVESLAMRSAGTEDDKSVTFEISGPVQQPNVEDAYPYSMIGAGLTLPAAHPTIGTTKADIIPYIHQNFGASVAEPVGFNVDMLDATLTINNSLKINTYPDGDNEPFLSEVIYQGRSIQMEWTAEYEDMTEYRTFHEASKVVDMLWGGQHLLQYQPSTTVGAVTTIYPYRFNCYMPSVAISAASQIMSAGEAEETLEQTYTADLINRAIEEDTTAATPTDQDLVFADDMARHAFQITTPGLATTDPDRHLSFVQVLLVKTVDLADGVDLTMSVWSGDATPTAGGSPLSSSTVVKTDWISNQVVSFVFENPPRLDPMTTYWLVLQSSAAIPSPQLSISGDSTTGISATSDDAGAAWTAGTIQWVSKTGYGGFPLVIEVETDAGLVI